MPETKGANIVLMVVGGTLALFFLLVLVGGASTLVDFRFGQQRPVSMYIPLVCGIFLFLSGLVGFIRLRKQ
jgi:hypothetical protein